MGLQFEHHTWGMLLAEDRAHVAGDEKVVAYSSGIAAHVQSRVGQIRNHIRTGLNSAILGDQDAYGFFPVGEDKYVACHFQVSPLKEQGRRAQPTFCHYIWVDMSQLLELDWNLKPVFDLFKETSIYSSVEVQPPLVINATFPDGAWLETIRSRISLIQSILIRYLNNNRIGIISGPNDQMHRLHLLCSIAQCLPLEIRKNLSFCTISDPANSSAKIIFPATNGSSLSIVDWQTPPNIAGPGSVYVTWISEISQKSAKDFIKEIADLRFLGRSGFQQPASELDLAVEFGHWSKTSDQIAIRSRADLAKLAHDISKFYPVLQEGEVIRWLGMIVAYAILFSEYELGSKVVAERSHIFEQTDSKKLIVERIVNDVFAHSYATPLAQFVYRLDALVRKNSSLVIEGFTRDLVLACLVWSSERDLKQGLNFWEHLKNLNWATESQWLIMVLGKFGAINAEDLLLLINFISPLADLEVFQELGKLLDRSSSSVSEQYPQTAALLKCFSAKEAQLPELKVLDRLAGSYEEVKSPDWFVISTRIVLTSLQIEAFSSRHFINAFDKFLKEYKQDSCAEKICRVLASRPMLFYATSQENLESIFQASITPMPGAGEVATLCFIALLKRMSISDETNSTLFANHLTQLSSLDAREVGQWLATENFDISHLTYANLRLWINFLKDLLIRIGKSQFLSRLSTMLIAAIEFVAKLQRYQTVADIEAVITASEDQSGRSLAPTLSRVVNEIIRTSDTSSWIYLATIFSANRKNLLPLYQGVVKVTCKSLPIDQANFASLLDAQALLRSKGFPWESAILVFTLLRSATERDLEKLSVHLVTGILEINSNGLSIKDVGEVLDVNILSDDSNRLSTFGRFLIARNIGSAEKVVLFCESIVRRANHGKIPKKYKPEKTKNIPYEEIGICFVTRIYYELREQLLILQRDSGWIAKFRLFKSKDRRP